VVFGFAIVGSVVREFSRVTRSVLARHPNGVPDAAEAELANASVNMHAPSNAPSRRAFTEPIDLSLDDRPAENGT
jgi:hypothetical protein